MRSATLYTRQGCHLCDEARDLLRSLARDTGTDLDLREIDIEADEALLREYLERIPVIVIGGAIVSELVPDAVALRSALLDTLRS